MRKFILCFLIVVFMSFFIFRINDTRTMTNAQPDEFEILISSYQSYDSTKLANYRKKYQETNNIIYTLNSINHPNFLIAKNDEKDYLQTTPILVNRTFGLAGNYLPKNLVAITAFPHIERPNQVMQIERVVFEAYRDLYDAASSEEIELIIYSAYRSYAYQEELFGKAVLESSYVALPGHSEHQTGLALDIATIDSGLTEHFVATRSYRFLSENAHKYGFIIRYPKDKENITGYSFEPWHFRYVGTEIATICFDNHLTLEEYYYQYQEIVL